MEDQRELNGYEKHLNQGSGKISIVVVVEVFNELWIVGPIGYTH